ncbi:tetratricopeptide repeat protein [Spirillospora sp. NPDC052269]
MTTQRIRVASGFAYGAVGADIHVFGDGTPVYLLRRRVDGIELDSAWMRAQPSRLLDARAEVVDFTGRDGELQTLRAWRDGEPHLAVRWLHGEGGQGKTRLAGQLARESAARGWLVVDAVHGTDGAPPAEGSQDLSLAGKSGVLLVVDYADRWSQTDLTWLFHNRILRGQVPARVLLIGRSASGWPALTGALDRFRENIDTSDQFLAPLPDDGDVRRRMFDAARDSFIQHYPQARGTIGPPTVLTDSGFGLTLTLHMAALAAVDAAAFGRTPPSDMVGLTTYLLGREHENWQSLYESADRGLDHRTSGEVMARAVFTAILAGPVTVAEADTFLATVMPAADAGPIRVDHARCYPSTDAVSVLQPMLPDRLAEDFLALMLPGHTISAFQPDPWATSVPGLLLSSPATAACAPRTLTFLAAATDRWPHVGTSVLYPLVKDRPATAVGAGSAALTAIAEIGAADRTLDPDLLAVLQAIEPLLPEHEHIDLDIGALHVAERLTAHRLSHTTDPQHRAHLHARVGRRRSRAGLWSEALSDAEEAVRIYRRLADTDQRYLPPLAMELDFLADTLSHHGRSREALVQARQSVAIHRGLSESAPEHAGTLATSLLNLASRLTDQGLADDGLIAAAEAVEIRRRLADADPVHLPDLAVAHNDHGALLSGADRHEEALAAAGMAVEISRDLAMTWPAEHLHLLAGSATNLGRPLHALGRHAEALAATDEAIGAYRRLASANPAAYRPALVLVLLNSGMMLGHLGSVPEALQRSEEAVQLARQLAEIDPVLHRPVLVKALAGHGGLLLKAGRKDEAVAALDEAVRLDEVVRLDEDRREAGTSEEEQAYWRRIHRLAGLYEDLGDRANQARLLLNLTAARWSNPQDVVAVGRRAAQLYAELGDRESEVVALTNLSVHLEHVDREEAIALNERVVQLYRELGNRDFEAAALTNLSSMLIGAGRHQEAVTAARLARGLFAELSHPDTEGAPLYNLGRALLNAGETDEAIEVLRLAANADREKGRGEHEDSGRPRAEADALETLADALAAVGRFDEAATAQRQAGVLFEQLGNSNEIRRAHLRRCGHMIEGGRRTESIALAERVIAASRSAGDGESEAQALSYCGVALLDDERIQECLPPLREAIAIFGELDDPALADHEAAALNNLGQALGSLGQKESSAAAYKRAAQKWRQCGRRADEQAALYQVGMQSFANHRPEAAVPAFEAAAEICADLGNAPGEANARVGLAAALKESGKFTSGAAQARRARELFIAEGDASGSDFALHILRAALHRNNPPKDASLELLTARRFAEAAIAAERSAAAYRALGDDWGEADALIRLGMALNAIDRPADAIAPLTRSVAYFSATADPEGESRALFSLGDSTAAVGSLREAAALYRRCYGLLRVTGAESLQKPVLFGEARALFTFAAKLTAARTPGSTAERITAFQRAAECYKLGGDPVSGAVALANLAWALIEAGSPDKGIEAGRESLAVLGAADSPKYEQKALDVLGRALMAAGPEHYEEAIPVLKQSAELARRLNDDIEEGVTLMLLGAILVDTGRYAQALPVNKRAAECLVRAGLHGQAQIAIEQADKAASRLRNAPGGR